MSEKLLHLGYGFSLPADEFIETKFGVIGQSGRGKTGLVRRVLEECHGVRLPFVVMDPSGILWGLRSSYDGKGPGLPILVIGGEHGDVPLQKNAGADVARAIVSANVSCVVDLSQESKTTYRTFAKDFAETLFAINDAPRLVVLDEAPELVPQSLTGRPDLAVTFDAIERLVRQGRNKGIGVMLVSQRAATISKDVLTQCGSLFVFGLVGTPDRKALREWVQAYGSEAQLKEFEEGLASLEVRECWFWSPSQFKAFRKIRVSDFHTFHPDRTHLRKIGMLAAKAVTTDVSGIVSKLGAQMERLAKEKADVAELPRLRREVASLQAKLAARPSAPSAEPVSKELRRQLHALEVQVAEQRNGREAGWKAYEALKASVDRARGTFNSAVDAAVSKVTTSRTQPQGSFPPLHFHLPPEPRPQPAMVPTKPENGELTLLAGERRMLDWLAGAKLAGRKLSRAQVGTLAGMSYTSGSYSNYMGHLKSAGLVSEDEQGLEATDDGLALSGRTEPMQTDGKALVAMWSSKLLAGERRMLDALVEAGDDGLTRTELAERSGMTGSSGSFSNYVGTLKRNAIAIERDGRLRTPEEFRD
jgi:uncharacterized protein